jgi:hypothetical protein
MQRVYAEQAKSDAEASGEATADKPADEDVVDAEFEEVKEDRK